MGSRDDLLEEKDSDNTLASVVTGVCGRLLGLVHDRQDFNNPSIKAKKLGDRGTLKNHPAQVFISQMRRLRPREKGLV